MPQYILCERCDFQKGDSVDNKYNVDKVLGTGTFGCVYRVSDCENKVYALKLLKLWEVQPSEREELIRRFNMEFETGKIPSNYLVHSFLKGTVKGNPYILMEFCSGGDLISAVESSSLDLVNVAVEILYGLKDLHRCGKVHRDLKPENVLIRSNGTVVLTDFGISGDRNNRLTSRGFNGVPTQMFGTFGYMPPEQINPKRGNATVLPTTDIFSFGVMMYQLLTGRLPFGRLESETDIPRYLERGKQGSWDRDGLSKFTKGMDWMPLIEGCLVPDFRMRIQNVDDALEKIPNFGNNVGIDMKYVPVDSKLTKPQLKIVNGVLLRVMQGDEPGREYRLDDIAGTGSLLTLGRKSCDTYNSIEISETDTTFVSRCHSTLERDADGKGWVIRDGQWRVKCESGKRMSGVNPCMFCPNPCPFLNRIFEWYRSVNGTYVNSNEVDDIGLGICPGDVITIGDVKLRVEGY